jgi:hypothetical protein
MSHSWECKCICVCYTTHVHTYNLTCSNDVYVDFIVLLKTDERELEWHDHVTHLRRLLMYGHLYLFTYHIYVHMYKRDFMIGSVICNGLLTEKNNFSFMKVLWALLQISVPVFHFYELSTLGDVEVNAVVFWLEIDVPPCHFTWGWEQIQFLKCCILFRLLNDRQSSETQ